MKKKPEKKKDLSDEELLALADEVMDRYADHRKLKIRGITPKDRFAALELIHEHKEISAYFLHFASIWEKKILEYSKPKYKGLYNDTVAKFHHMLEFVTHFMDQVDMAWKTRDKRREKAKQERKV